MNESRICNRSRNIAPIKHIIFNIFYLLNNIKDITNIQVSNPKKVESKIYEPKTYNKAISNPIHDC